MNGFDSEWETTQNGQTGPILEIGTQVGRCISRVRWLHAGETFIPDALATEFFLVSTYGEDSNTVSLWKLNAIETGYENKFKTTCLHKANLAGNITGITVLDGDNFALTTSLGIMSVFKISHKHVGLDSMEPSGFSLVDTRSLHSFSGRMPAPATDIVATDPTSVVTVGEDGSIYEYSIKTKEIVRSFEKADPLSISVVSSIGRSEIVTGNGGGQVKLWDLRSSSNQPVVVLCPNVLLNNLAGAVSIAQYPSQSHVLFVGYQSGCMDLWDIRRGTGCQPAANLVSEASTGGAIGEIQFHRINEDHFFTCNQLGSISHWFPSEDDDVEMLQRNLDNFEHLNIEFLRRGLSYLDMYSSPLAINSLSISPNDRILCGGDSGVAYITDISGV
ncbi:unnamed protein product [Allacma fusca]|uniref:Nucleoporin Nup43 n=1 Tax=Allacma fusca TaxID=39272 RepID=A0A8J2LQS5_9HEXA|nr:unnamed protein product [Allacma fusca]